MLHSYSLTGNKYNFYITAVKFGYLILYKKCGLGWFSIFISKMFHYGLYVNTFLDFKFSPCSLFSMFSFR